MRTVIIIGASGHGKVVADIIQKSGDIVYGFLDDNTELKNDFLGFPILGKIENYKKYKHIAEFIIAIGDAHVRSDISKKVARCQNIYSSSSSSCNIRLRCINW